MNCLTTLRKHTLLIFVCCFFSFSGIGQIQTIITSLGESGNPCIGQSLVITMTFLNPSISSSGFTDNNPFDGITAFDICSNCDGSMGIIGLYTLSINVASGTVGSTQTFTITLESPNSFIDGTGRGMMTSATTIQFLISVMVNEVPTVTIVPTTVELCDGDTENIVASITNGATNITAYTWAADGGDGGFENGANPGNTAIASVEAADTYRVSVTNNCGTGNAFRAVTTNNTPSIQMSCMDNGDGTTTITADILNDADDVTVRFFNDANLHTTSNNNDGPGDDPSITVSNNMFNQQVFTVNGENSCGNATVLGSCFVLPVELLFFRGKALEKDVVLEWATATELNNDFFTVERSFDGRNFIPIENLEGAGNSQQELYYEFTDKNVAAFANSNKVYYRLKQTDFDGAFAYSETIALTIDARHLFDILNQYFQDDLLKLSIFNPVSAPLDIQLYDLNGRQIRHLQLPPQQGKTDLSLDVPNLKVGFYIITISNGDRRVSRKVGKLK